MLFTKLDIHPPIIAHRGASFFAPENTLAAFGKAKEIGASWVEFDVMLTADHEVVVIHDETLERTTNGIGHVNEIMLRDLKKLDAGSWFHINFTNEKISTLREVIRFLNNIELSANIEIKAQIGFEALTVEQVLKIIQSEWKSSHSQVFISSFSLPILKLVRKKSDASLIGFLMDEWNSDWKSICDDLDASAVDVNYKILTPLYIQEIKETGRTLLVYTVNDPVLAAQLFSWGVDAVFSDCPESMLPILLENK